jgi:probable F420-dependent oxidoreductase
VSDPPLICVHPGSTDLSYSVVEIALEAEQRGLHGVYLSEHTHFPVGADRGLYPGAHNREVPDRYARLLDPFVALSCIAQATGLELGTSVCLPCQHDPIALAKTTATLDHLSGGRLVLGVGFGWNREEIRNHGVSPHRRASVLEEAVGVMRALWQDDVASYYGDHFELSPSWSWPKPAQRGGPPVLLGARGSERNFRRIARWADGWITMENPIMEAKFEGQVRKLNKIWSEAGRPGAPTVVAQLAPEPLARMREWIPRCEELGVGKLNVVLEDDPRDVVLPILDDLASLA